MNNKVDFLPINIAIVTISDTRDLDNDKSGDVLAHRIEHSGHNIVARKIVKDDFKQITQLFQNLINNEKIDVVISTGGTGLTGRAVSYTHLTLPTMFEV